MLEYLAPRGGHWEGVRVPGTEGEVTGRVLEYLAPRGGGHWEGVRVPGTEGEVTGRVLEYLAPRGRSLGGC